MKTLQITIMIFIAALLTANVRAQKKSADPNIPSVDEIVQKANLTSYYQGDDGKATVHMVITDKQGREREREFVILRKDLEDGGKQNYYVYFLKPADVRKMVFMVHKFPQLDRDDDRWLYLPNLDLVKRIAASDKRTSFVGSDYLYEDVSGRSLEADTHELADVNDQYFVVKNTPKDKDLVEFAYYNVYIDRKTYMPMLMEYFDQDGKMYRYIKSLKVEKIGENKYPTVTKSIVRDLRRGSTTEMEFSDIEYDINLPDIFTERYLRRPPRRVLR